MDAWPWSPDEPQHDEPEQAAARARRRRARGRVGDVPRSRSASFPRMRPRPTAASSYDPSSFHTPSRSRPATGAVRLCHTVGGEPGSVAASPPERLDGGCGRCPRRGRRAPGGGTNVTSMSVDPGATTAPARRAVRTRQPQGRPRREPGGRRGRTRRGAAGAAAARRWPEPPCLEGHRRRARRPRLPRAVARRPGPRRQRVAGRSRATRWRTWPSDLETCSTRSTGRPAVVGASMGGMTSLLDPGPQRAPALRGHRPGRRHALDGAGGRRGASPGS